jgi:hypothetical protein
MNNKPSNYNIHNDDLDPQLEAAVWAVLSEPLSADAIQRVKTQAITVGDTQSGTVQPSRTSETPRTRHSRRWALAGIAIAASLLVIVLPAFFKTDSLFAQVAERLEKLKTLVCRIQFVDDSALVDVDGSNGQKLTYLAPSHYRLRDEMVGRTEIINTETGEYLVLHDGSKEAIQMTRLGIAPMLTQSPVPLVETVRKHFRLGRQHLDSVQELGSRRIDGELAIGLRSQIDGETVEAWFDPQSLLPVQIRVQFAIPSHMTGVQNMAMWRVMSDFEFDVAVKEELFSTSLPEGYNRFAFELPQPDTSAITLDDLVNMLRRCAEVNDSQFPRSLAANDDEGTPLGIQSKFALKFEKELAEGGDSQERAWKTFNEFSSTVARGTGFLFSLNEDNRLRYFGGARLNEVDRPIFWYSPSGDDRFKIVYADLTIKDVGLSSLPPEPAPLATGKINGDLRSVRVSTPRFELPRSAVVDYNQLETIRKQGKQKEVQYLTLGLMQEFIESPFTFKPGEPIVQKVVPNGWKPDRALDSNRLAFLSEFTNLKGLDLANLYLTQKDLDSVAQCNSLERLSLSGIHVMEESSRRLSGGDLQKLAGLIQLESLDLSQANFAGGIKHLASLPKLHTLFLSSFENLNDGTVAELSVLPQLETLVLAPVYSTNPKTTVTEAGLEGLKRLTALKTLYVGYHGKFTLPVDRLRVLLPNVEVKAPQDGVPGAN